MKTPAERYEDLLNKLGGTNKDLGEMQSIADEILKVGFNAAVDYVEYIVGDLKVANALKKAKLFEKEAAATDTTT